MSHEDEDKTVELIETVIDAAPPLVEIAVRGTVELVEHVPAVGSAAKGLARVALEPTEAERRMALADHELATERAHRLPEVEAQLERITQQLRLLSRRMTVESRIEPLRHEIAKLVLLGRIEEREIAESPELANATFLAYRDIADALDPRVAVCYARLVEIYRDTPMTRAGRSIATFLRILEPSELPVAFQYGQALRMGLDAGPLSSRRIPITVSSLNSEGVPPGSTQLTVILQEQGAPPSAHVERILAGSPDARPLHVMRLLLFANVGVGGTVWHEADHAGLTAPVARALTYVLIGGNAPSAP